MPRSTAYAAQVALVLVALAGPALATEITVRNDSFEEGDAVFIVGDFVPGEHAGARFTAPCDGAIVEVQIAWLSETGDTGLSFERAIHIYEGSTFPVPGAELLLLEGPVLTDGAFNQFRYVDQENTIPINIPISAGQQFYVTLEFDNPTDVGNGGPSVVRDIDGCQAGCNVLCAIPGGWMNFCIHLQGDLLIRAVIDCPGATGACCSADGSCTDDVEQDDCEAEFGAVWHEGLSCAEVTCAPRGACCRMGGCLQLVEQPVCEALGGVYAGDGANCDDDVCIPGACCMPDGECLEVFGFECAALGGDFQGAGTTCDPNPCPQPEGACCFGEICVAGQTEEGCAGAGGEWAGAWTDCDDNNGNGVADACEEPTTCAGDTDHDGDVDLNDLAQLLSHYGTVSGAAWEDGDFDGDGDVDLSDLGALLANYGQDCA